MRQKTKVAAAATRPAVAKNRPICSRVGARFSEPALPSRAARRRFRLSSCSEGTSRSGTSRGAAGSSGRSAIGGEAAGVVGGGATSFDATREALGGTARGSSTSSELEARITAGYDAHMGAMTLSPYASLQYTNVHLQGYEERGSIAPGKFGDFVVLSRDILDPAERDKIADTKVEMTVVGGKIVFERK